MASDGRPPAPAGAVLPAVIEASGPRAAESGAASTGEREREAALIARCLDGDPEAFRPLVERYSPALHGFAARYVGSEGARDVVQDAFLRAYRSLVDYDPGYRFSTWLYRIALNLCRDAQKRSQARVGRTADLDPASIGEDWTRAEGRIDDARICEAAIATLRELPPAYGEALLLKDVEGMEYREVSRITGLPVGLLKVRVMRGRRRLAQALERKGIARKGTGGKP